MSRIASQFRRPHRALTLVECLIASFLLALGASAVMVAISSSFQHSKFSSEERAATEVGRQLLEQVAALPYIDPQDPDFEALAPSGAQGMSGYADTVDSSGAPATGEGTYARSLQVAPAADAGVAAVPGAGMATVTVTSPSGQFMRLRQILHVR